MKDIRVTERELTYLCPLCCNRVSMKVKQTFEIDMDVSDYGVRNMILSKVDEPRIPYVGCPYCDCEMINVDRAVAPAILMLWNADIRTATCCEGHLNQGRCYAVFGNSQVMRDHVTPRGCVGLDVIGTIGPYIDILTTPENHDRLIECLEVLSRDNTEWSFPSIIADGVSFKHREDTLYYYEWDRPGEGSDVEHLIRIATFGDLRKLTYLEYDYGVRLHIVGHADRGDVLNISVNPMVSNTIDPDYYTAAENLLKSARRSLVDLVEALIHLMSHPDHLEKMK